MHCCALYPLGHARSQPQAGFTNTVILIPQAMLDPSSNRISAPCVPSPSGPAGPKLHVGWPDPCSAEIPALWAVGPRFSLDPCSIVSPAPQVPHTSSPVGPQLHVEWLDPCPARIPTTWALLNPHPAGIPTLESGHQLSMRNCIPQPIGIPVPQAWPGPSSTGSPGSSSDCH
jgi:hypothetical protein